jgi:hypothetical protein
VTDSTKGRPDTIGDLSSQDFIDLRDLDVQGAIFKSYSADSNRTSFRIDINDDGKPDMLIQAIGDLTGFNNFLI